MKILTYIHENETFEIEQLFEKLSSLNSMAGTLADAKLNIDEENWFYKKLMDDIADTNKKFKDWWKNICDKYNLDKKNLDNYIVNFRENFIYLN